MSGWRVVLGGRRQRCLDPAPEGSGRQCLFAHSDPELVARPSWRGDLETGLAPTPDIADARPELVYPAERQIFAHEAGPDV